MRGVRYRYSDGGETTKESYIRKWYSINRPLSPQALSWPAPPSSTPSPTHQANPCSLLCSAAPALACPQYPSVHPSDYHSPPANIVPHPITDMIPAVVFVGLPLFPPTNLNGKGETTVVSVGLPEIPRLAGTLPPELTHTASDILAALHSAVFDDDALRGEEKKQRAAVLRKEKKGERN
jgi:hypothetical protein